VLASVAFSDPRMPEAAERERLGHPFAERARGTGVGALELPGEQLELVEGTVVIVKRPRPPQPAARPGGPRAARRPASAARIDPKEALGKIGL